jgi:hypothetical protein
MRAKLVNESAKFLTPKSKEELENFPIISIVAECRKVTCGDNESKGRVPDGLGIGDGKYIKLNIDFKTGKIENWKSLTSDEIQTIFWQASYDLMHDPGFGAR